MYAKEHDLCFIPIAPASDNPKTEYDLSRFTEAHKRDFESAFAEIESGKKKTHWMWYIFPQISGLGKRDTAVMYSIKDINEAKAFLDDKYLGGNLRKICEVLLKLPIDNAEIIFGPTDAKKLKSSMTLFLRATNDNTIFKAVLDKFFDGNQDYLTVNILNHN